MENKNAESGTGDGLSQAIKAIALILVGLIFTAFGWYSIDVTWKEKDPVESVFESLPGEQQSLKKLTAQLVEMDQRALKEVIAEHGDDFWLQEAKSDYPERFIVSPEWFAVVAQSKEISYHQAKKLIEKVAEGPLSTTDAAYWALGVSDSLKSKGAYEEQKEGVQVLIEAFNEGSKAP